jgi:hypothetical protein|mmetsp:Transcript_2891/g.5424  ORF Transcript_2891/g.5424 Transcript_2891/m.5424 type:complete len:942 (-) Transcript_2891:9-2834(-)
MGGDVEEDAVQVAVRMRVFNGREKAANATRIVRMENLDKGSKTYVQDPDTGEERDFKYDYSFQSHSTTEQGIGQWADQDTVMQTLGIPVLNAALEGRNVSLFAYGQTGAGKSFSMLGKVGVPELEGIIPRSCREIFRRQKEETDPLVKVDIDIQVVEVYCEQVNDLLSDRKVWPAQGHKPRLTPKDGYVVDTIKKPCFKYEDIWECMEFADKNRSVGSHALNPESSRAHTIYQINYCRCQKNEQGKVMQTITAKLNLIDLAGSERTDSAGTTGQMLKEGNAINLSLTALGGCIKALSEGKRPNFRDSKLTLLLQASMTSGKVIMIAALSPASICYAESLSTLKFADRIKQVKIKSSKNVSEDPVAEIKKAMEEMRAAMQQEIDTLKASLGGDVVIGNLGAGAEVEELQRMLEEQTAAEAKMKEDLEAKIKALQESEEDRKGRAADIDSQWANALGGVSMVKREDEDRPYFVNLHEDERIAETLIYAFDAGQTLMGKANKDEPPKIELGGLGILKGHCTVHVEEDKVYIEPHNNSKTMVNGKKISSKTRIVHQNRIWLGNNYAFRFCHPKYEIYGEGQEEDPDYFQAEAEVTEAAAGGVGGGGAQEEWMSNQLKHRLAEAEKKVEQANLIATDLEKDISFAPKIFENRTTHDTEVAVHVQMGTQSLVWTWGKFCLRIVEMVNVWSEWQKCEARGETMRDLEPAEDPFVDIESQLIGETDVWLNALANMVEFAADTSILSVFGQVQGKMHVEINPCDRNGNTGPWDDEEDDLDPFVDDPNDLLGKDIEFEVKISNVTLDQKLLGVNGVPKFDHCFVRYKFDPDDDDEKSWSKTKELSTGFSLPFDYSNKHKVRVTKDILQHITKGRITLGLWGSLSTKVFDASTPQTSSHMSSRLEEKKKQLDQLEAKVQELQKRLTNKNTLIAERNKELLELEKQIAAKKNG